MSIFPKKTIRGKSVTIHWNFVPTGIYKPYICPYVRIGVVDPAGNTHMLFEQHIIVFAPKDEPVTAKPQKAINKETPLLILASYLAYQSGKEQIKEMLARMEQGIHRYFVFDVPQDALPGKYTLLSELYVEGALKHSLTREDDFFYVESLSANSIDSDSVMVKNHSPEPCSAELVYINAEQITTEHLIIDPHSAITLAVTKPAFLQYNEGRELLALHALQEPLLNKNQQLICLPSQNDADPLHVMHVGAEDAYLLEDDYAAIWNSTNGLHTPHPTPDTPLAEMIEAGLIVPMYEFTSNGQKKP
jgi:hypothetical protein